MTFIEILITIVSLCTAGTGGLAIKCFCFKPQIVQAQEEKLDEAGINSMEVEHPSIHSVEDIISQVVAQHKRNSKEGTDLETHVDITINVHSINHNDGEIS